MIVLPFLAGLLLFASPVIGFWLVVMYLCECSKNS